MAADRKRRRKSDVHKLLDQLSDQEQSFLKTQFLAPTEGGPTVRVRIGGVACKLRVEPADFVGFGIFQPLSHTEAILDRPATMAERKRYLQLFPQVRLIVCERRGSAWRGSTASFGDARIQLDGLAPIRLAEEVQLFDCVRVRYDGQQFWFDELDARHDPGAAHYLRSALQEMLLPEDLERPGLTSEERAAYELNYWQRIPEQEATDEPAPQRRTRGRRRDTRSDPASESDTVRERLRESLTHAGADLIDYLEREDSFRVTFSMGRRRYTSSVSKSDLTVQVAGICLSGEDQKFDLGSLVGVLREGQRNHEIYEVGGEYGMDEEEYWRAHPPGNR